MTFDNYFEPFVGSGAVFGRLKPAYGVIGDNYAPLIELWKLVKHDATAVSEEYRKNWLALQRNGPDYFYEVRHRFNKTFDPNALLFLTRTCVNGLIRFNAAGEFNNSFHLTRPGIHPNRLEAILERWQGMLRGVDVMHADYRETTAAAAASDVVYLDPPYRGTSTMYASKIDHEELYEYLDGLTSGGIRWLLSYDGSTEERDYLCELPADLYVRKLMLRTGHSTFRKTQMGSASSVHESLYMNF